jgi:BirA family transcriptional regulator, biotin operon repressor / biotin---[acetyl-CoA-carboxylase] ligase
MPGEPPRHRASAARLGPDTAIPDDLSRALAAVAPRLSTIGSQIFWYPEITSTNDVAALFAERGADEGCVVVADAQSAGRGRLGRTWASPAGAGIYASLILRPDAGSSSLITLAAGVGVAEGIEAATGLAADVKWPNDIYVAGRKLAGILAETGIGADGRSHVILGFGINIMPAAYPPDVATRATSIESELGRIVDRGLVLAECLTAIGRRYADLRQERSAAVLDLWRRRAAATFGRPVLIQGADGPQRGTVERVDDSGALIVLTPAGPVRVIGGEIKWI